MLRIKFLVVLTVGCWLGVADQSKADLIYNILPQALIHESNNSDQEITGGTIRMVDGANTDGILTAGEILEVIVHNSMSGTLIANDAFDITNVNLTFSGNQLNGEMRVQHTSTGMAFVDWGGGGLLSVSDSTLNEYASAQWVSPFTIATGIPEPAGVGVSVMCLIGVVMRRRR